MLRYFSRDEMYGEIREILYVQASHILALANVDAANAFLGFEAFSDPREFEEGIQKEILECIRPERFTMTGILEDYRQWLFENKDYTSIGLDVRFTGPILNSIPCCDVEGGVPTSLGEDGLCHNLLAYVAAAAVVGQFLHSGGCGYVPELTVRTVATLAMTAEGTVRNAMAGRTPTLPSHRRPDGSVGIALDDAIRWIAGRRGFLPRPTELGSDMCETMLGQEDQAYGLRWLAIKAHWCAGPVSRIAATLGWKVSDVEALLAGRFPEDKARLRAFAAAVRLDDADSFCRAVQAFRTGEGAQ